VTELADVQLDGLFTPFEVKSLKLRNRFAMAPMTREFSPDGIATPAVAEYYRRRVAGGVGLIITEGTYIPDPAAGPSTAVPRMYGEESLGGWKAVVEAVHAEGGAIIPQLWHTGVARGGHPAFNPDVVSVSPSGVAFDGSPKGRAIETVELDQLREWWVEAAVNARNTGFDGIELHGAHGYLLDEFLWERTNRRADGYGGSIEERVRFPAEIVAAIREAVGPDFAIVYRFSQWKGGYYDTRVAQDPAELERLLTPLADAGVDVLHASTRRYWDAAFPELDGTDGELGLAGWTRRVTGLPTITVGSVGLDEVFTTTWTPDGDANVTNVDLLVERFGRGEFDLVAIGRALLSDPEWVGKLREGRAAEHVPYTNAYREFLR